jgi:hypothetical protein
MKPDFNSAYANLSAAVIAGRVADPSSSEGWVVFPFGARQFSPFMRSIIAHKPQSSFA